MKRKGPADYGAFFLRWTRARDLGPRARLPLNRASAVMTIREQFQAKKRSGLSWQRCSLVARSVLRDSAWNRRTAASGASVLSAVAGVMLPIPDPDKLLAWAESAPYQRLCNFISNFGARGHSPTTISRLVRVAERRRWIEEDRVRVQRKRPVTERERVWSALDRRELKQRTLKDLRALDPTEFEHYVTGLFCAQGYRALATGKPADYGVDVEIRDQAGKLWAVVQCKRYTNRSKVRSDHVMAFAGAFMFSKAERGFLITTGELTGQASKTAKAFPWLTVICAGQLIEYAQGIAAKGVKTGNT